MALTELNNILQHVLLLLEKSEQALVDVSAEHSLTEPRVFHTVCSADRCLMRLKQITFELNPDETNCGESMLGCKTGDFDYFGG